MKHFCAFFACSFFVLCHSFSISPSLLMDIPIQLKGIEEIADKYDVFLFDQFGAIHNGDKPLPGAVDVIEKLRSLGKKTVVVSNTSSRKDITKTKYHNLGFPEDSMDGFITSGEIAHLFIANNYIEKKAM